MFAMCACSPGEESLFPAKKINQIRNKDYQKRFYTQSVWRRLGGRREVARIWNDDDNRWCQQHVNIAHVCGPGFGWNVSNSRLGGKLNFAQLVWWNLVLSLIQSVISRPKIEHLQCYYKSPAPTIKQQSHKENDNNNNNAHCSKQKEST